MLVYKIQILQQYYCIVNRRGEVSKNDNSSNGDVKMLYGFFRNQNCCDIQFLIKNNKHSHVYFLLSYYKQGIHTI